VSRSLADLSALMRASVTSVEHLSDLSSVGCPKGLVDAERLGVEASVSPQVLRSILRTWVMVSGTGKGYESLIEVLSTWDHRLGVWCAIACVQQVIDELKSQPPRWAPSTDAPAHALKLTRQWVLGECPDEDLVMAGKVTLRRASTGANGDVVSVPCGTLAVGAGYEDPTTINLAVNLAVINLAVNLAVAYAADVYTNIEYGGYMDTPVTQAWDGFLVTIAKAIDTFPLHYKGDDDVE